MIDDADLLYRQHLTEADRRLLGRAAGADVPIEVALGDLRVEQAVFAGDDRGLADVSPFLTFAVAVHRTRARLETVTYVAEPWAARQRIPVFDGGRLRELLADPAVRFFLVELLASYTHVSSGSTWQRTRRGWRRRRFSELDPVRLAGLLEVVDPVERAGVFRRLGDLALFLAGVFPDHPLIGDLGGASIDRLFRVSGLAPPGDDRPGGRQLLELLGPRWYRAAAKSVRTHAFDQPVPATVAVVEKVAERFLDARRILNTVTDHYLFPLRQRWFGVS